MESMLRGRVQRVTEKLAVMQGRREAIDKSLLELELSRIKLTSSRMLSQDREELSSIFSELAGSTVCHRQPFPIWGCWAISRKHARQSSWPKRSWK